MVLDGKKISEEIRQELREKVEIFGEKGMKKPGLAVVIVGENKASQIYVKSKIKSCNEIGILSTHISLPEITEEKSLLEEIDKLNNNPDIHGILVQLPLPEHINPQNIIERINPLKDVDCFTAVNIGKIFLGERKTAYPCTPAGVLELMKRYSIEIEGKNAVIVGRSNIVGKPLSLMLINEGATVTVCNSKTQDIKAITKTADILIAAVGQKNFITEDMVKEGAVVIDVGINRVDGKIYGDVDYDNVVHKASYITPVPGGIGPMTVAMLLKNCIRLYKNIEVKNEN